MKGERPTGAGWLPWLIVGVAVLSIALAWLWLGRERAVQEPPVVMTVGPAEATAVAQAVEKSVAQVQLGATPAPVAVIGAGGTLLGVVPTPGSPLAGPIPTVEVRLASGTIVAGVVRTDEITGISAVDLRIGGNRPPSVELGTSTELVAGQALFLAPSGGAANVPVTYRGTAVTIHPQTGLGQRVLELELPVGVSAAPQGAVLDARSRLVGLVLPDRQTGAAPGRLYAVPAEFARPLFERLGIIPGATPEPQGTRPPEDTD